MGLGLHVPTKVLEMLNGTRKAHRQEQEQDAIALANAERDTQFT